MIKALWVTAGCISLGLGILGIVLPLLPTTPFILLASACFMRGSERLHQRLLAHKVMGPIISDWQTSRSIDKRVKNKAYIFIVASFGISIALAPIAWVKALLGIIFVILMVWFVRVPSNCS
ncbi:YbaN family protein [Vibrio gallicus]|uniref:YbaN family protein n=1 Tax=Vibrio gallicus TaxID=190897 RepID=UPI0021C36695|nr:YbaN family protein [Vibrio gallicus]